LTGSILALRRGQLTELAYIGECGAQSMASAAPPNRHCGDLRFVHPPAQRLQRRRRFIGCLGAEMR
jgi:hypothetical protein